MCVLEFFFLNSYFSQLTSTPKTHTQVITMEHNTFIHRKRCSVHRSFAARKQRDHDSTRDWKSLLISLRTLEIGSHRRRRLRRDHFVSVHENEDDDDDASMTQTVYLVVFFFSLIHRQRRHETNRPTQMWFSVHFRAGTSNSDKLGGK